MESQVIKIEKPEGLNMILGQAHFIKTVEDVYEAVVSSVPGIKFGMAFCESSGPCLVRSAGTEDTLTELAKKNAYALSAGHLFIVFLREAYPINVLNAIKNIPEVCTIYCASANPVEVVLAETDQGRGVLGVIDGMRSKGVETSQDVVRRKELLRKIGYKL